MVVAHTNTMHLGSRRTLSRECRFSHVEQIESNQEYKIESNQEYKKESNQEYKLFCIQDGVYTCQAVIREALGSALDEIPANMCDCLRQSAAVDLVGLMRDSGCKTHPPYLLLSICVIEHVVFLFRCYCL